jgi:hypothetical protein
MQPLKKESHPLVVWSEVTYIKRNNSGVLTKDPMMILGVNLGYHSKKFYPLIKISILSVRMKLFVSPLVHSLKTYDLFLFIDKQKRKLSIHELVIDF